ncbi:ABC transporter ATP-binding protein [Corynebacterium sp. sy039]|uniref:ABC transporter ATP-binding protein n=1 Tax=Corynebacterium sp. sy039 TaxID=2599641 RepID=UPI0011B5A7E6|nr:ATP-binding cassette domain-containing protein [Corynebacterium sp. sy039]QDZ43295.1 ATP-binding cassette domain-containing protein [Corynebacterium sp. sy039]
MLDLHNITLDIQDGSTTRRLLDNVSLRIEDGEVVGLTGPSGSGKSTLLAVAAGLQHPTGGRAVLNGSLELATPHARSRVGRNVKAGYSSRSSRNSRANHASRSGAALRRRTIGIVFQQPNLLPALTAKEQLLVMHRLEHPFGLSRRRWRDSSRRASELLANVGLADKENARVSELSGGQQARVNLARALMNDPQLLLIDEPTAALDTQAATAVTDLIMDIAHQRRIPVLYVSHDQAQLERVDRVETMVDGRMLLPVG